MLEMRSYVTLASTIAATVVVTAASTVAVGRAGRITRDLITRSTWLVSSLARLSSF
jgi:hypothetical protein